MHLTVDAGTMKTQRIAAPLAGEVVLFGQCIGSFLRQCLSLCQRQRVSPDQLDVRHANALGAVTRYFACSIADGPPTRGVDPGCQPMIASITKNPATYATATGQPCRIQRPTDRASGYMLDSATPADDPNQIIEPPNPTA